MKKATTLICLCLLVISLLFMFAFTVFLPRTTVSDYSYLASFPEFSFESLFSGEYFSDVMYYFTDTVHGRDRFIDFESRIRSLYGLEEEQKLIVNNPDDVDEDDPSYSENSSTADDSGFESSNVDIDQSVDSSPESSVPDTSDVISEDENDSSEVEQQDAEISGSILIVGTRGLELFYGNLNNGKLFAETISGFADRMQDVNVYSMVIPKSSAYYLEQAEGYDNLVYRNKDNIENIAQNLSENVIDVNIYNILGQHAKEDIYFRTDHHWTALGAYYASSVFVEKAGVAFNDLSAFTEERREGYVGTILKYSDYNPTILNNPEDFVAFYPDADYTVTYYAPTDLKSSPRDHEGGFFWEISDNQKSSWYSTFLRGDSYSVKAVSNDCKNGRKLLIVKDSYGNALAPFLIEGFEEIYIVDARTYARKLDETVDEFGITDVLFTECTFSAVGKSYINALKEICKE